MLQIEYIVEGEHHTMKTRTPDTGVLVIHISNIAALPFLTLRGRSISQCLLLESLKCLIAALVALRTGVDYCMYQAQLVRTLGTWGVGLFHRVHFFI